MNCEQAREALSARADGEPSVASAERVDAHLVGCPECLAWVDAAQRLTRRLRVRPVTTVPDLTAAILAAADRVPLPDAPRRRWGPARRWLLAAVAGAQCGVVLLDQFDAHPTADGAHLFNEGTAWNVALAVGFGAAALRPRLAAGLLPALAAFVAVLTAFAVVDLADGLAGALREGTHLLVVAGLVLLWLVARDVRRPRGTAWAVDDSRDEQVDLADLVDVPSTPRQTPRSRRGLRPAGRRVA